MSTLSRSRRPLVVLLACVPVILGGSGASLSDPLLSGVFVAPGPVLRLVDAADFNADGFTDLVALDEAQAVRVYLGSPELPFGLPASFSYLSGAAKVTAIADMDGDRKPDLVVGTHVDVEILLNRGHGLQERPQTPVLGSVDGLTVGDFDSDGVVDIATTRNSAPGVAVTISFMRADDPYLQAARQISLPPGRGPIALVGADFDGDGDLDLAALNQCDSSACAHGSVSIYRNEGGRVFAAPRSFGVGVSPASLQTGDFNEDGHPDLVSGNRDPEGLSILLGRGDGSFADETRLSPTVSVALDQRAVAVGDWNLDGHADLVVSGSLAYGALSGSIGMIAVLDGRGDGTFTPSGIYGASMVPAGVVSGDFDGDRKPDLAIRSWNAEAYGPRAGGIVVLPGDGQGGFVGVEAFHTPLLGASFVMDIATADFNRDGRRDLVVADPALTVFLQDLDGRYLPMPFLSGYSANAVAIGDFNDDGVEDLVLADNESISILPGNGDGTFQPGTTFPTLYQPRDIVAADFDLDGRDDIAVLHTYNYVSIFRGQGDGTLREEAQHIACPYPSALMLGDFHPDGRQDIAVMCGDRIVMFFNVPDFLSGPFEVTTGTHIAMTHADFNGDGNEDMAVIAASSVFADFGKVRILLGHGDAAFSEGPDWFVEGGVPVSIAAADFNADGRADLSVGVRGLGYPARTELHLGDGDGTFTRAGAVLTIQPPYYMLADDLDADGRPDLFVGGPPSLAYTSLLVSRNIGPLPDADGDGTPNPADTCTDADSDGFGDPDFPANQCPADNCRDVPNPSQADGDGDGIGDACDRCTDRDRDETGDPGFPLDVCPVDNCPDVPNVNQRDSDRDGIGDACDPCTDRDGDGYGEPGNACQEDNCPLVSNPDQADVDGDRIGDVCDPCPFDPLNDFDGDHVCGDIDNCPDFNADQSDADNDRVGDHCDNCLTVPNHDQVDTNADGSGDACQPSLILSDIRGDGNGAIDVSVAASDPQGEPLSGTVEIVESQAQSLTIRDLLASGDCGQGWFPEGIPGDGIGFLFGSVGIPIVADFKTIVDILGLACDVHSFGGYYVRAGGCTGFGYGSNSLFLADLALPAPICVTNLDNLALRFEATIEAFDEDSLRLSFVQRRVLSVPFDDGLPGQIDISSLNVGPDHRLRITVTDGNTVPVTVEAPFDYQGESTMLFGGHAPRAVIAPRGPVECDRLEGGLVTLDSSGSEDPDSTPGTNDDIVRFEWFEDFETVETSLGEGETLTLTLPLGAHAITLRVTDTANMQTMQTVTVVVQDTTPPSLVVGAEPQVLWPPNHRLVTVATRWQAVDRCDPLPRVVLSAATSNEPADAPGNEDGATAADIVGAEVGQPDTEMMLRAERESGGPGRTYDLEYSATDASGNRGSALATVVVPHDLGSGPEPLQERLQTQGIPGRAQVFWNTVEGAPTYDLIRGGLENLVVRDGQVSLGRVRLLLAGQGQTSWNEGQEEDQPATGRAFFYLVQYHDARGPSGYGTESSPLPLIPDPAPGAAIGSGGDGGRVK
jgi:hypothetical protein